MKTAASTPSPTQKVTAIKKAPPVIKKALAKMALTKCF